MLKNYINIKIAVPTDALPVSYVGEVTFNESWRHIYTPEDMDMYTSSAFNVEAIENEISNFSNTFLLAFMNGKVAGYAKLRRDRQPQELNEAKAIEVERIYLLKEFQDKRIGYELMKRCIVIALEEKWEWIWLGVNEHNHKALTFYRQFDFEVFGKKSFQLGKMTDEDLMIKKRLDERKL